MDGMSEHISFYCFDSVRNIFLMPIDRALRRYKF